MLIDCLTESDLFWVLKIQWRFSYLITQLKIFEKAYLKLDEEFTAHVRTGKTWERKLESKQQDKWKWSTPVSVLFVTVNIAPTPAIAVGWISMLTLYTFIVVLSDCNFCSHSRSIVHAPLWNTPQYIWNNLYSTSSRSYAAPSSMSLGCMEEGAT